MLLAEALVPRRGGSVVHRVTNPCVAGRRSGVHAPHPTVGREAVRVLAARGVKLAAVTHNPHAGPTTDTVARLLGRRARTIATWASDHRAA
ncbi:hypothetical protein ACQPZX_38655 [Actinoplanes sp. CA-142083]|uniref:hypothetical protein n=1 Tax=Actinoplanes sp. CA-142083 TaxID=3239903 RepID=UPI003D8F9AA0